MASADSEVSILMDVALAMTENADDSRLHWLPYCNDDLMSEAEFVRKTALDEVSMVREKVVFAIPGEWYEL